ncbi:MAG: hypothetical protein JRH14_10240 [Deltaproteobacteria bacterium]|nr:hypothetical protein [Deltaproteobacteria bacterium]
MADQKWQTKNKHGRLDVFLIDLGVVLSVVDHLEATHQILHDRVLRHQAPERREIRGVFFERREQSSEALAKQVVPEVTEAGLFRGLFEEVGLPKPRKLQAHRVQGRAGAIEGSNCEG